MTYRELKRGYAAGVCFQGCATPSLFAPGHGRALMPLDRAAFERAAEGMTTFNPLGKINPDGIAAFKAALERA